MTGLPSYPSDDELPRPAPDSPLAMLPRYPEASGDRLHPRDYPTRREVLCALFQFAVGMALVHVLLGLVLALFTGLDATAAHAVLLIETVLLGAVLGMVAGSTVEFPEEMVWVTPYAGMLFAGGLVGFGLNRVLARGFGIIERAGRPLGGPLDGVVFLALYGAVLGIIAGGVLALIGSRLNEGFPAVFTAPGRAVCDGLRRLLFRQRSRTDLVIPLWLWLEVAVWLALVAGTVAWFIV